MIRDKLHLFSAYPTQNTMTINKQSNTLTSFTTNKQTTIEDHNIWTTIYIQKTTIATGYKQLHCTQCHDKKLTTNGTKKEGTQTLIYKTYETTVYNNKKYIN